MKYLSPLCQPRRGIGKRCGSYARSAPATRAETRERGHSEHIAQGRRWSVQGGCTRSSKSDETRHKEITLSASSSRGREERGGVHTVADLGTADLTAAFEVDLNELTLKAGVSTTF